MVNEKCRKESIVLSVVCLALKSLAHMPCNPSLPLPLPPLGLLIQFRATCSEPVPRK
jgi:hypothetical protein